jgi:hypothetical protein
MDRTITRSRILTEQELCERYSDTFKELRAKGYHWDKDLSISCAGVVFSNGVKMWIFALDDQEPIHTDIPQTN